MSPGCELRDVVRQQVVEQTAGVVPAELDSPHVGDVEQPGSVTDGLMLVDDRAVLDRHLPAGKVDHPTAVGHVPGIASRSQHSIAPSALTQWANCVPPSI